MNESHNIVVSEPATGEKPVVKDTEGPSLIIRYAFALGIGAIILAMATALCIRLVSWAIG